MSGRKDYSFSYSEIRQQQLMAEQERRRQERMERQRRRFRENRANARAAATAAIEKTKAALRKKSAQSKAAIAATWKTTNQLIEEVRTEIQSQKDFQKAKKTARAIRDDQKDSAAESREETRKRNRSELEELKIQNSIANAEQLDEIKSNRSEIIDNANLNTESGNPDGVEAFFHSQMTKARDVINEAIELGIEDTALLNEINTIHEKGDKGIKPQQLSEIDNFIHRTIRLCDQRKMLLDDLTIHVEKLISWQDALQNDGNVSTFQKNTLGLWLSDLAETVETVEHQPAEAIKGTQQLIIRAEAIQREAGELSDRFHERNTVLRDIVDSLKEVGFFVQDPEFVNPDEPQGTVIVRANRGDQIMTAEVDLNEVVRSDWQGVDGEYCTNAFFDYVKALNEKGVSVDPVSPALKPNLKRKGAKDLPGSTIGEEKQKGEM